MGPGMDLLENPADLGDDDLVVNLSLALDLMEKLSPHVVTGKADCKSFDNAFTVARNYALALSAELVQRASVVK